MTQSPPEIPTAVGHVSTRLRATAVPLAQLADDMTAAHQALHAATTDAAASAAVAHDELRRTKSQRRGERLAAIEARNKHAAGPAE